MSFRVTFKLGKRSATRWVYAADSAQAERLVRAQLSAEGLETREIQAEAVLFDEPDLFGT